MEHFYSGKKLPEGLLYLFGGPEKKFFPYENFRLWDTLWHAIYSTSKALWVPSGTSLSSSNLVRVGTAEMAAWSPVL